MVSLTVILSPIAADGGAKSLPRTAPASGDPGIWSESSWRPIQRRVGSDPILPRKRGRRPSAQDDAVGHVELVNLTQLGTTPQRLGVDRSRRIVVGLARLRRSS